jgi:hypothetical protein
MRDFREGDIVCEYGSCIKVLVLETETRVERIRIKILNGEEEGEERWVDAIEYDFYFPKNGEG